MPSESEAERHLAETFADVARAMFGAADVDATLQRIVVLAAATLEHCDSAGITMERRGVITSPASTDPLARQLDELQRELGEGPCVDVLDDNVTAVIIDDISSERRWPDFARRANEETTFCSLLAVRLGASPDATTDPVAATGATGALNLYSRRSHAFDEVDLGMATVFATHASLALAHAEMRQDLEAKAESRDLIGRAKGILMAHQNVSDDEAFDLLRRASQRLNVKLTEIADTVTYTGDLPSEPFGSQ